MLVLLLALASPVCNLIQTEWLYGRNLAAAVPALSEIAPAVRIGLAPCRARNAFFESLN
jgi:hypothetical protein